MRKQSILLRYERSMQQASPGKKKKDFVSLKKKVNFLFLSL